MIVVQVISGKEYKAGKYMVFATNKEIGLQILPFDGNPYKTLGMIGHPRKVRSVVYNVRDCFTTLHRNTKKSIDPGYEFIIKANFSLILIYHYI